MLKPHVAIFGSLLLLAFATYCVFGFLATFEPSTHATQFLLFRIGYVVAGLSSILGAFWMSKVLRK